MIDLTVRFDDAGFICWLKQRGRKEMTMKVERDFLNADACDDIIDRFLACKRSHLDTDIVQRYDPNSIVIAANLVGDLSDVVERVRLTLKDAWRASEMSHIHSCVIATSAGDALEMHIRPKSPPNCSHVSFIYLNNGNVGFSGGELVLLADSLQIEPRTGLLVAMTTGDHPCVVKPIIRGISYVIMMKFQCQPARLSFAGSPPLGQTDWVESFPAR